MSFYCLINPYRGKSLEQNVANAAKATYLLNAMGYPVLSLNGHAHFTRMVNELTDEESKNFAYSLVPSVMQEAKGVIVLKLQDWDKSAGVKWEIELAEKNNIPIYYFSLEEIINEDIKL